MIHHGKRLLLSFVAVGLSVVLGVTGFMYTPVYAGTEGAAPNEPGQSGEAPQGELPDGEGGGDGGGGGVGGGDGGGAGGEEPGTPGTPGSGGEGEPEGGQPEDPDATEEEDGEADPGMMTAFGEGDVGMAAVEGEWTYVIVEKLSDFDEFFEEGDDQGFNIWTDFFSGRSCVEYYEYDNVNYSYYWVEFEYVGPGAYIVKYSGTSKTPKVPGTLGGEDVVSCAIASNDWKQRALTSVDFSEATSIKGLRFERITFTGLDLAKLTDLEALSLYNCGISSIDTQYNTKLEVLNITYPFDSLSTTGSKAKGPATPTALNLRNNASLEYLRLRGVKLTTLDLSSNTELVALEYMGSELVSLNLRSCVNLERLTINLTMKLSALDLSANSKLTYVEIGLTGIAALDFKNCHDLQSLILSSSKVATLDLGGLSALESLSCYSNAGLRAINISGCTGLNFFNASWNALTSIDVASLPAGCPISVANNNITDPVLLEALLAIATVNNIGSWDPLEDILPQKNVNFLVRFDDGDSTVIATKAIKNGAKLGALPVPKKSGYIFDAWYDDDGNQKKITKDTQVKRPSYYGWVSPEIITYYAHWKEAWDVTFDLAYGTSTPTTVQVAKGGKIGALPNPARIGYKFEGWFPSVGPKVTKDTVVTEDVTYFARWKENPYTVTFNGNGGAVVTKNKPVVFGQAYGTLNDPKPRAGYVFLGWFDAKAGGVEVLGTDVVKTAANHTLFAYWKPIIYDVTYDLNLPDGATGAEFADGGTAPKLLSFAYGAALGKLPGAGWLEDGNDNAFILSGWFTARTGGKKITEKTKVSGDVTYYARWDKAWRVTYTDRSNHLETRLVKQGKAHGAFPQAGANHGHRLSWKDSAGAAVKTSTKPKGHSSYVTAWAPIVSTIKLNAGGGTVKPASYKASFNGNHGDAFVGSGSLPVPKRANHDFDGWWTEPDRTTLPETYGENAGTEITGTTPVIHTANGTIFAHWTAHKYDVVFDLNVGTHSFTEGHLGLSGWADGKLSRNIWCGQPFGAVVPDGLNTEFGGTSYVFLGWFTSPAKTGGTKITSATKASLSHKDKTYYARWAPAFSVKWIDTSLAGVPGAEKTTMVQQGTAIGALPAPTVIPAGYALSGWFTSPTGGTKITAKTKVTAASAKVFYARWTPAKFNVSYAPNYSGAKAIKAKSVTYLQRYGALSKPSRAGYDFLGWYTLDGTSGWGQEVSATTFVTRTGPHTLYARWQARSNIVVRFDANGGTAINPFLANKTVTYDGTIGFTPTPTRPNDAKGTRYKFMGWYTAKKGGQVVTAATKVNFTATKVYYARWAPAWQVTFDYSPGGAGYSAYNETYIVEKGKKLGTAVAALPEPTGDPGMGFVGWSKRDDRMWVIDEVTLDTVPIRDGTYYAYYDFN